MTSGFARRRRGREVFATFSAGEADLLRSLAQQLIELLRADEPVTTTESDPFEALLGAEGPVTAPDDPVLARLLPAAYRDDDEAAGDFRRFTEPELRGAKAGNAASVILVLEDAGLPEQVAGAEDLVIDVELGRYEAMAWLKALTDMRLAIATRLGIQEGEEDFWDELEDDDPRAPAHGIYDWLGHVQETLVRAVAS